MRRGSRGSSTWAASNCIRTPCAPAISNIRTNCASISIRARRRWEDVRTRRARGAGAPRGGGLARLAQDQRFARDARERADRAALDIPEVRRAALALSRAVERRAPALASSKWWKEERHGVFLDYNQNAKDRTTCSAYSVRPLPDARVSTPLHWHEVPDCDPADFTVLTVPKRFAEVGDPHADMDAAAGSLEKLLELAAKDEAAGLGDAPWPPHFARWKARLRAWRPRGPSPRRKKPRTKMPLIVVANSPDKEAALAGLERWKSRHPEAAGLLAVDDVLVDSMRGRSSTWTRIRVNLRHVPEACGRRRKLPIPMTIRHANGANGAKTVARSRVERSAFARARRCP